MNEFEKKLFFNALKSKLREDKIFVGIPVARSPLDKTKTSFVEDDFVELHESNLKRLKAFGELVVAEMKDGTEYYIIPTVQESQKMMEDIMPYCKRWNSFSSS